MPKATVRVIKRNGEWTVKRDGSTRYRYFDSQKEAYLYAREIALRDGLTITVYYPTGGIQKVISPKNGGRSSDEGNCFITTACVNYFNLKDDCSQLQTLRNFRDTYLLHSKEGEDLIKKYYKIAPQIVKELNKSKSKDLTYKKIFKQINLACNLIHQKEFEKAKLLYIKIVTLLMIDFNLK